MPKIPRLSSKLPKIPAKNNALYSNGQGSASEGEGEIRPEQIAAMSQLKRLGKNAVSPYVEGIKRIFKSLPTQSQSLPVAGGIMSSMEANKKRLRDAMNGKF